MNTGIGNPKHLKRALEKIIRRMSKLGFDYDKDYREWDEYKALEAALKKRNLDGEEDSQDWWLVSASHLEKNVHDDSTWFKSS